jgi:hypothetical protein
MAFFVSVGLFCYFWVIGFAVQNLLYRHDDLIRTVLIAPAVGIVTTLYGNYLFSRFGLPVGAIARPLALGLSAVSIAILLWRRPPLPGRRGLPYLLVLVLAFVASGWPLLTHGFAWLAHLNPDAANYILDTDRLVRQPFIGAPDRDSWLNQSDWGSYYVTYPLRGVRTGSDLLFSWITSLIGRDEPALFMPLIVALHVAALAAGTALIGTAWRFARLLSGALLAVAALASAGVELQLLGQELGLVFLTLASILLLSPFYRLSRAAMARFVILTSLVTAAFFISYPEMLPFLGVGFVFYHGAGARELGRHWRRCLVPLALIAVISSVLVAPDVVPAVNFLLGQARASQTQMLYPELFPYLLIPSGIGALWGLNSYVPGGVAPLGRDVAIGLGLALSGATMIGTAWMLRRREACAALVAVMVLVAVVLAMSNSGFGMFKLAMYAQPFLMATMVLSLCRALKVAR